MSHLETHRTRVEAWGNERGLYDTDSPLVQFGKMVEEVGELIMAIGKSDVEGIKDAIGDVRVCLIGVCAIAGVNFEQFLVATGRERFSIVDTYKMAESVAHGVDIIGTSSFSEENLLQVLAYVGGGTIRVNHVLGFWCKFYGLTLEECDNHAWDQIKNRKGKTVDGEFIKDQA